ALFSVAIARKVLLQPVHALTLADTYCINGRIVPRRQVTYPEMKHAVSVYFDRRLLQYVRPYITIKHHLVNEMADEQSVTFHDGEIDDIPLNNPTVVAMFHLELMRRYPNIDRRTISPYLDSLEAAVKKRFDEERNQTVMKIKAQVPLRADTYLFKAY